MMLSDMSQSSLTRVTDLLAEFVTGQANLSAFNRQFAPLAWEADSLNDEAAEQLIYSIEIALGEYDAGHFDETELIDRLTALLAYVREGPIVRLLSSESKRPARTITAGLISVQVQSDPARPLLMRRNPWGKLPDGLRMSEPVEAQTSSETMEFTVGP